MQTYVLITSGRRWAIIWRPGRPTSHYWLTTASLQRIQRCTAQGQLVRLYYGQATYLLQGGAL